MAETYNGAAPRPGDFEAAVAATAVALNDLSERHYHLSLQNVLANVETPLARRQFARLIGVMVKEPFAIQIARPPSESTGAVFRLDWKADDELRGLKDSAWQYAFMRELLSEQRGSLLSDDEALAMLSYYHYEFNLGKFVFEAFRERICSDPRTSKAVRDAIAQAKRAGVQLTDPTVTGLSVGAASMVAVTVASHLTPVLAAVGAPVIGGMALLLMQVGVDGFCRWTRAVIEEPQPSDRADA